MVEPIMYFAAGFLIASLLGLVLIPLVHGRAVRLTMKRIEAARPLSVAEIQADKDQLRADFAITTRRLELAVEQLKAKTTNQMAELGKKSDAVGRMKAELTDKIAAIAALEERERAVKDQLRRTEEEANRALERLREADAERAEQAAQLAQLSAALDQRNVAADSQRIEIVALNTQMQTLHDRVAESERDLRESERRRSAEHEQGQRLMQALQDERGAVAELSARVVEIESRLAAETAEAGAISRRARELEFGLAEQERLLAQRERDYEQLAVQLANARNLEADLRAELSAQEGRHDAAMQSQRSERMRLQEEVERAAEERGRLQREVAALQREGASQFAVERRENALLRERINDIAAEIARLTAMLEGEDSPIEQMLAGPPGPRGGNGAPGHAGEAGLAPPLMPERSAGSLADRIRALQSRGARVPARS
jgi:chromosome segregation ATPase